MSFRHKSILWNEAFLAPCILLSVILSALGTSDRLLAHSVIILSPERYAHPFRDRDLCYTISYLSSIEGIDSSPRHGVSDTMIAKGLARVHQAYDEMVMRGMLPEERVAQIKAQDRNPPPGRGYFYVMLIRPGEETPAAFMRVLEARDNEFIHVGDRLEVADHTLRDIGFEATHPQLRNKMEVIRYELGRVVTPETKHRKDYLLELYYAALTFIAQRSRNPFAEPHDLEPGATLHSHNWFTILPSADQPDSAAYQVNAAWLMRRHEVGIYVEASGALYARLYRSLGFSEFASPSSLHTPDKYILKTTLSEALDQIIGPLEKMYAFWNNGDLDQAISTLEQMSAPHTKPILMKKGLLQLAAGNFAEARRIYSDLIERDPDTMIHRAYQLITLLALGDWHAAVEQATALDAQLTGAGFSLRFSPGYPGEWPPYPMLSTPDESHDLYGRGFDLLASFILVHAVLGIEALKRNEHQDPSQVKYAVQFVSGFALNSLRTKILKLPKQVSELIHQRYDAARAGGAAGP